MFISCFSLGLLKLNSSALIILWLMPLCARILLGSVLAVDLAWGSFSQIFSGITPACLTQALVS